MKQTDLQQPSSGFPGLGDRVPVLQQPSWQDACVGAPCDGAGAGDSSVEPGVLEFAGL